MHGDDERMTEDQGSFRLQNSQRTKLLVKGTVYKLLKTFCSENKVQSFICEIVQLHIRGNQFIDLKTLIFDFTSTYKFSAFATAK